MSQTLNEHFALQQPAMLEALCEVVEMESPSTDKLLVDALGTRIAQRFGDLGARITVHPQERVGDHLEIVVDASGAPTSARPVLVLCHYDTVWSAGTLASRPFAIQDGRLSGPGVFDMKSGLVMLEFSLRAIRALGLPLPRPIVVLINSDEEIGSHTSRPLIERQALDAQHTLVLESPLAGGMLKTARKGVGGYRVQVEGRAAHAGLDPEKGISAVSELARLVPMIHALNNPLAETTLNVGVIRGGTRPNVVAAQAEAEVDVRVWTLAEADRINQAMLALRPANPGARVSVSGGLNRPPMERSAATATLFERAQTLALALGQELTEGAAGGGSDGNFTAALGVPTLDGLGALGDGAHAAHEYILPESLAPRAALLTALLTGL